MFIFNNDTETNVYDGYGISPSSYQTITKGMRTGVANDSDLLSHIGSGKAIMSTSASEVGHITDVAKAINYLKDIIEFTNPPFADKSVDGGSIYSRITGNSFSVAVGTTYLELDITYPKVKFTGVEIIGGEVGDKVDLLILDSDTGTYSGVGNTPLNQFGYSVNIAPGFYSRESPYDGDLYYGMTVLIKYTSVSAKTIHPNFIIHEIK